jgi:hypothetical protein
MIKVPAVGGLRPAVVADRFEDDVFEALERGFLALDASTEPVAWDRLVSEEETGRSSCEEARVSVSSSSSGEAFR